MYECPNCGGNLKFDIPSQLLKCAYCETTRDPYTVSKDQDAEENSVFDVTVFTCPQCGGEIMSTDTSAAAFAARPPSFRAVSAWKTGRHTSFPLSRPRTPAKRLIWHG